VKDFLKKASNKLHIVYKDMYTDTNDAAESIKYYVNMDTVVNLSANMKKSMTFFLRKGDLSEKNAFLPNPVKSETFQMGSTTQEAEAS
jgi:hypothetical protein